MAAFTRWMRSSRQFPDIKMNKNGSATDDSESLEGRWQEELSAVYNEVDREVARRSPVCQLSGRCCRFEEYGHTLFVSTVEVRFLVSAAGPPQRALDQGATCPWQDSRGQCAAREARPLGCRVYYCDPSFQEDSHDLSERFISRLKELSTTHGLPWNYAPLHRHLHEEQRQGRLPDSRATALRVQIHEPSSEGDASFDPDS
jgi:Fe-S-cluster containining protein